MWLALPKICEPNCGFGCPTNDARWLRHDTDADATVHPLAECGQAELITAYADSIYELAKFAEHEDLPVRPQTAIITSYTMLYPFMREKIETVFQCKVYNRYE